MNLNSDLNSKEKLRKLKKNIISWYPICQNQTVLQVGQDIPIFQELKNKTDKVTVVEPKDIQSITGIYDFVILIGVLEKLNTQEEIMELLNFAKNKIGENGKILLAMQNKFGMKYWAGQKAAKQDKHYETLISSKENVWSFPKVKKILGDLNLKFKFYYPLPDYTLTNVIYTDEFMPDNESIDSRLLTFCKEEDVLNFSERESYKQLLNEDKKLFPFFSNSFFLEIANKENFEDIKFVSFGILRKPEYRIRTVIREKDVYKYADDLQAKEHIQKISNNLRILKEANIDCLGKQMGDGIETEFLKNATSLDKIFMKIYEEKGLNELLGRIKEFKTGILDKLLMAKENGKPDVFSKYQVAIPENLKQKLHFTANGIMDLTFQNFLVKDEVSYAYDQEWFEENVPVEFILYRAILYFTELRNQENEELLYEKLDLSEFVTYFKELEDKIQERIMDQDIWDKHLASVNSIGNIENNQEKLKLSENHIHNLESSIEDYKRQIQDFEQNIQNCQETIRLSNDHIKNLETSITSYKNEMVSKEQEIKNKQIEIEEKEQTITEFEIGIQGYRQGVEDLTNLIHEKDAQLEGYANQLRIISNSLSWKITKPIRMLSWILSPTSGASLIDRILPPGGKRRMEYDRKKTEKKYAKRVANYFKLTDEETAEYWKGIDHRKHLRQEKALERQAKDELDDYEKWVVANQLTEEELDLQRKVKFNRKPKISVVIPLYNTDTRFFRELLYYMHCQTYTNWELCLADGSPEPLKDIQKMCEKDKRIKYKVLEENRGIAENTNEAIKLATGDFIGLLDHDDILTEDCLYEVVKCINKNPDVDFIYTDEDKIEEIDDLGFVPHFKPDFAPDTLRSNNYICHFSVYRRELMDKLGGERTQYDGAQDFDLILRMSEETQNIAHIPKVLYHWRISKTSTAGSAEAKPYAYESGIRAVEDHIKRLGLKGKVTFGVGPGFYKTQYDVIGNPKVTILIPNKDGVDMLEVCLKSVLEQTTYTNYEIVILENNSEKPETFEYYKKIEENEKITVLYYPEKGFNYSKIINFGVKNTSGDFVVQLNNDTKLLTPDWLEKMIGFAQREDVGGVGVRLYYPDDTIQHAGIIIGVLDLAAHMYRNLPKNICGYFAKDRITQNFNAVTAACIMTKREIYEQVGYMNEDFAVAFNDVDFCLRIRKLGKLIVYNPDVELIHYESKTRPYDEAPDQTERFHREINLCIEIWKDKIINGDEYYNKNLRLDNDQYTYKTGKVEY